MLSGLGVGMTSICRLWLFGDLLNPGGFTWLEWLDDMLGRRMFFVIRCAFGRSDSMDIYPLRQLSHTCNM